MAFEEPEGVWRLTAAKRGTALATVIGKLLRRHGWSLALAESCTGGLLAHRIVSVPGCSDWFCGGVTAYANRAKTRLLGVLPGRLVAHGAVSAETACDMARGARRAFDADVAVAVTGIAGPSGGTTDKPVGLVFVAVANAWGVRAERFVFCGGRARIREQGAIAALRLLHAVLSRGDMPYGEEG